MQKFYAKVNVFDEKGRHEFYTRKIPDHATPEEQIAIAMKLAQECFTSIVEIENAALEFEKQEGHSLNLPKRRVISTNVMQDYYAGPVIIWQKKFDKVN
jgi:hypothetical protein